MKLRSCIALAALAMLALPNAARADECVGFGPPSPAVLYGNVASADLCPFETNSIEEMAQAFHRTAAAKRQERRRERDLERRRREAERRATLRRAAERHATLVSPSEAHVPRLAPRAVKEAIEAANSIATTPYVWGGGHGSFESSGYDCSGAVSVALHGAGLLDTTLTSGELESYGDPGPGRWITIYANADHTYAVIAGLRWDTVGYGGGVGPRWHDEPPYPDEYVVRHPAGY